MYLVNSVVILNKIYDIQNFSFMWLFVGLGSFFGLFFFSMLSNKERPRMLLLLPIEKKGVCCPPSFLHLLGNCEHTLLAFPMWYTFFTCTGIVFSVYLRVKYNYLYIPYLKIKCFSRKYKKISIV